MKFTVVGNHTVDGVAPGGVVDIDDQVRSTRLVRGGHLAAAVDEHCPVAGCDYSGSERGLAQHTARSHGGDD